MENLIYQTTCLSELQVLVCFNGKETHPNSKCFNKLLLEETKVDFYRNLNLLLISTYITQNPVSIK